MKLTGYAGLVAGQDLNKTVEVQKSLWRGKLQLIYSQLHLHILDGVIKGQQKIEGPSKYLC